MDKNENTIQIVAFTTNSESSQFFLPYDIIKRFVKSQDHIFVKQKAGLALAFKLMLSKPNLYTKIMVCSALDLTREYNGIKEVNCYLFFVDLESKDSESQLNLIIKYFLKYCNLSRKIYILGLYSSNIENSLKNIDEKCIKKIMESSKINKYKYKEMNIEDNQIISKFLLDIFLEVEKISITKKKKSEETKENCLIY